MRVGVRDLLPSSVSPVIRQTQWQFQATNGDSVPLYVGMPVASLDGRVYRASASSHWRAQIVGLVMGGASPTSIAGAMPTLGTFVVPQGLVVLTEEQWTDVTIEPGGLIVDALYYLSTELGRLTVNPPTETGTFVVPVGRARSPHMFSMRPFIMPILL